MRFGGKKALPNETLWKRNSKRIYRLITLERLSRQKGLNKT